MRMVTCLAIVQKRTKGERLPVIIAKGKDICPGTVQMAAAVVAAEAVEVSKSLIITNYNESQTSWNRQSFINLRGFILDFRFSIY